MTAKIATSTPAMSTGEWRRASAPSSLRRLRVTSPQNSRASEPTPAKPPRVRSTLNSSEAGSRRSWAVPTPCSAEAPSTAISNRASRRRSRGPVPTAALPVGARGELRPRSKATAP